MYKGSKGYSLSRESAQCHRDDFNHSLGYSLVNRDENVIGWISNPCYNKRKNTGDQQMSLMIGLKRDNYFVLASESRAVSKNGDVISDHQQKILSFPDKKLIVGYTGRNTYINGDIKTMIEDTIERSQSYDAVYQLKDMAMRIQKELRPEESLDLHVSQCVNGSLFYIVIECAYECVIEKTILRPFVLRSGINIDNFSRSFLSEENVKIDIETVKGCIKDEIAYAKEKVKKPLIGGKIQCYLLDKTGTIRDYSE